MNGIGIRPSQLAARSAAFLGILVATACSSTPVESTPPPSVKIEPTPAALIRDEAPVLGPPRRVQIYDEREPGWNAQGVYLGAFAAYEGIVGDDYGDDNVLVGPTDIVIIPDVDDDNGWGGIIGYRWRRWELYSSYAKFKHDSDFAGNDHDYKANWLDFNFRYYFLVDTVIQPYVLAGGGISRAKVDNGTSDGISTTGAKYKDGISLNLGAGVSFFPIPWLNLYSQAQYRFAKYEKQNGIDGNFENDIDADTWEVSAGAMFRLFPGK